MDRSHDSLRPHPGVEGAPNGHAAIGPSPAAVWKVLARRLSQPGRERMKVFDPDTKSYLKTRRITDTLPTLMAAVYLYKNRRTTLLALDFDSKTTGPDQVDTDFERARDWLLSCGARLISDRSANGGRHILVPLAIGTTASFEEVQPLMRQLQARLPSLDITPMQNAPEGCISLPGTPCAGGGYRQIDGSLTDALNAVTERSAPTLLPELYAMLGTVPPPPPKTTTTFPAGTGTSPHTIGAGDDERLAERYRWSKPIPQDVLDFAAAQTITLIPRRPKGSPKRKTRNPGCWESPSEARMSVVLNAVLRGYSLNDIRACSQPGQPWSGLGDSYRTHEPRRPDVHLAADVRRALDYTATLAAEANRSAHRFNYPHGGSATEGPLAHWLAYALAWADHEFRASSFRWTVRDVCQALAIKAALAGEMATGTPVVGVGGRSVSLSAGLMPPTTVFDVLRRIRDMIGSPIVLARHAVGKKADHYALTTENPDNLSPTPLERVLVADVHPAWSVLGRQHRAVYDLIAHTGLTRPADIYAAAQISARSGQLSLSALATAGLVVRQGRMVALGPVSLDDIAAAHHLDETLAERIDRFRRERAAWHDWLALQDQLRGLTIPPDHQETSAGWGAMDHVFGDEQEYLAAVLAHGPPDVEPLAADDELAAIELLADLLGARILAAARGG